MNLPNYFLADLPSEATLTAEMIAEACQTLKRNREQYLRPKSTDYIVRVLSELGASWLAEDYPFRREALAAGPAATGFSAPIIARGLDSFFRQLTAENLRALLEQDLGHVKRLDKFAGAEFVKEKTAAQMAIGPELLFHITAGNIPNPTFSSMILGLLTRSAQFVKCASGGAFLPRLFAHSLYELEPKLGACLELATWRGGARAIEETLYGEADCITATGSDQALEEIRRHLPPGKRFLEYGHKVSFCFIDQRVLRGLGVAQTVASAADDVVAWDQLGCLSPQVIYVQFEGEIPPERFAELLALELENRESVEPRGQVGVEVAAAIASRRAFYEVRAASSPDTRMWCSKDSTAWTVVFEGDPRFQTSCLHRFVYVKGVASLEEAMQAADAVMGKVSTVGLGAEEDTAPEMALALARWGAPRVCPLGQMQNPPLTWHHDGRPPLGDLVRWCDWER